MLKHLKRAVFTLAAACCCVEAAVAQGYEIERSHSGSWYDPEHAGHGLIVEVMDTESLLIYWPTYQPDGTPMWLMSVAEIEGDTASGEIFYSTGMEFGVFDPATLIHERWGTISLRFLDCFNARLNYESDVSDGGASFGSGEIALERLTTISGLPCPVSLEPGYFGNYVATLGPDPAGWTIDYSDVRIHMDGDLAYRAVSRDAEEFAFGRLIPTGDGGFRFEVETNCDEGNGLSKTCIRKGSADLQPGRVSLDLGELGVLSGEVKPDFTQPVNFDDLVGTFYRRIETITPGTIVELSFEISPDGVVTASDATSPWGCPVVAQLTLSEPGYNQVKLEGVLNCGSFGDEGKRRIVALGEFDPLIGRLYLIEHVQNQPVWTPFGTFPRQFWYQKK